jgi:hypothetical protein
VRAVKSKPVRVLLRLVIAFVGCGVLVLGAVPLLGPTWHLLFGDKVSYAGWEIPVPKGFYVRKSQDRLTMWKLSFGVPLFAVPYGHVSLFFRPGPSFLLSQHYQQFAETVSQEAAVGGYAVQRQTFAAGGSPAYCLQLGRSAAPPNSLVRCAIEGTGIAVFYEGDRRYLPDFYTLLEHMSSGSAGAMDRKSGVAQP